MRPNCMKYKDILDLLNSENMQKLLTSGKGIG